MTVGTVRMGEFFSGPGGMALGAREAARDVDGIELIHSWANDLDRDTCETYLENILRPEYGSAAKLVERADELPGGTGGIINQNVREVDIDALGAIDGFAFGFPCNDYSLVGERKGLTGEFGPLYSYGVRVLAAKKPDWFVAENVSGLRAANEGEAFKQILRHLRNPAEGLEYRIVPHLYSFDEYNTPQRRKRIVIVGIRDDLELDFRVPSPELYAGLDVSSERALTVPPIPFGAPNHDFARQSANVVERLSYLRPGENAFSPRALQFMPERLKIKTKTTISTTYRRLVADQPSYTVTGAGGGGSHMYHWDETRALTNRERARLQTFPDSFIFKGKRESVRKQVGMAVPVHGAQAIFTALFRTLAGEAYRGVEANLQVERIIGID